MSQTLPLSNDPARERATQTVQSLAQFARVVRYRKSLVGTIVCASFLLGGLYYTTATRLYQAKASLLVLQTGSDVTNTAMTAEGMRQGMMPTFERLFSSTVVVDGALTRLAPDERIDFQSVSPEKWPSVLRANMTASTLRQTNIIEVTYRSQSRQASVSVVNALLQSYLDFMDRTHKGTAGQIIEVVTREKTQLEQRLAAKELEVLETRRRFGDLGIRAGTNVVHPTVQRALSLNEALVKTQQKRIELQASAGALQSAILRGEDLQPHLLGLENAVGREFLMAGFGLGAKDVEAQAQLERSLVESQAELQTLLAYYGPAHPRVVAVQDRINSTSGYLAEQQARVDAKLAGIRDKQLGPMLSQLVQQRLNETWQHENSLRNSFDEAREEAVELNGDMARLDILEHDLRWLRDLRDVLLNQIASVDLRQDHGDIRTAVVSEPVLPTIAIWPRLSILGAACLFGGLGVALACVYAIDLCDDHFRSPEELKAHLGVNLLAMVRDMPGLGSTTSAQQYPKQGHSPIVHSPLGLAGLHVFAKPNSPESEGFRTLRTSLGLADHETSRIVISSAEPGDGKTTVLANLAVSFAQFGKRTLMIDADLRRPGLTALLGARGQPGLSDTLMGTARLQEAGVDQIQSLGLENLDFLPAGPRHPHSAELLAGSRLAELLAWAESRYDQILIDSPPALAASDASIIGRLVDGLVLVVQPNKSQRRMVLRARESFVALSVNLLGVVVNRISSQKDDAIYGYGFNYGYGYDYSAEEAESATPLRMNGADETTVEAQEPPDSEARRAA